MEPAPGPLRFRMVPASCLVLVLGLAAAVACSADEAKEAAIRELAVGSWVCAPDAGGEGEQPLAVQIDDDGTFVVSPADSGVAEAMPAGYEISGTWTIEDGDLEWAFDDVQAAEKTMVPDFEDLTLESTEFRLLWAGMFETNDGSDDPADEQEIIVDARGTDSVTLRTPGGEPWTCDRQ